MILQVNFSGPFVFWFGPDSVTAYTPVCAGHVGYFDGFLTRVPMNPASYLFTAQTQDQPTIWFNPDKIMKIQQPADPNPAVPPYWKITMSRPSQIVATYPDTLPGQSGPPIYATGTMFLYNNFEYQSVSIVDDSGAPLNIGAYPSPSPDLLKTFTVEFHFAGPQPDGTDNDAIQCFGQMQKLYPSSAWPELPPPSPLSKIFRHSLTNDCKPPVVAQMTPDELAGMPS